MSGWLAAVLLIGSVWGPFLKPESREGRKGLSAYREGDYIEALTRFEQAKEKAREPRIYEYNAGLAAHQAGNPDAAVNYYLKAREAEAVDPGDADYNRGNALVDMDKPEEALAAYRQALRQDPDDEDARYNYEVLWRQMQADSSRSDSQSQENQQEQDSEAQPQDQEQQQQEEPQEGEGEKRQGQQEQSQPGTADPEGQDQGGAPEPTPSQAVPLDRQQAERLLNALMQGELDLLKSRLRGDPRKRAEKDW